MRYIKEKTGFDKVDYICHSQGGLIYFILYTLNQKVIENNFGHFISVGTVITTFTSESHLIKLGSFSKFPEIVDTLHINNILCFNKFLLNDEVIFEEDMLVSHDNPFYHKIHCNRLPNHHYYKYDD